MPLTHTAPALTLSATDEASLRRVAKSHTTAHRSVLRARALLLAYEGAAKNEIARRVSVNPNSVRAWRQRFEDEGLASIGRIAPGRGRKPSLPEGTTAEVVRLTMHEQPPDGSTQWSTRTLAKQLGISHDTVARIWKDHELKPWRVDPSRSPLIRTSKRNSSTSSGST